MLSDLLITPPPGKLDIPEPHASVAEVVLFIEKHLDAFSREYAGAGIKNENGLNQELSIFLNLKARQESRCFYFEKEYMEDEKKGTSPKVDFAVIPVNSQYYNKRQSFFSMEAT